MSDLVMTHRAVRPEAARLITARAASPSTAWAAAVILPLLVLLSVAMPPYADMTASEIYAQAD